ncbi:MAG: indole-3-glycerol phosphate synthase TrpC [Chloroflexi bacterium]|nr:indole-3-glycerol phosphate synthase TrpC [Chloroflexota bacterium]
MSILDDIVAKRRERLVQEKAIVPLAEMKARARAAPKPHPFAAALRGDRVRLIAEVKKASPSRGLLRPNFDPVSLAMTYARNGAAAISVLTEPDFFQGAPGHLEAIRHALDTSINPCPPLLRKDFIFDPLQVHEARSLGADAFLLIVAILEQGQLADLLALGRSLGMEALVEVHSEAEVEAALKGGAMVVGINNRDLKTFVTDIGTTNRLRPLIPRDKIVVSESGISTRQDMERLASWEVNAALVGEALVIAPDVAAKMRELVLPARGV